MLAEVIEIAEVARMAMKVRRDVLPAYSSKFFLCTFIQPQLMAVLCLMHFKDCIFCEAEVRLAEQFELRMVGDRCGKAEGKIKGVQAQMRRQCVQ